MGDLPALFNLNTDSHTPTPTDASTKTESESLTILLKALNAVLEQLIDRRGAPCAEEKEQREELDRALEGCFAAVGGGSSGGEHTSRQGDPSERYVEARTSARSDSKALLYEQAILLTRRITSHLLLLPHQPQHPHNLLAPSDNDQPCPTTLLHHTLLLRNALLPPISRLPPDLLSYIFALPHTLLLPVPTCASYALSISGTCSAWRALALSTPALWASIPVGDVQLRARLACSALTRCDCLPRKWVAEQRMERAREWLGRSRAVPVRLWVGQWARVEVGELVRTLLDRLDQGHEQGHKRAEGEGEGKGKGKEERGDESERRPKLQVQSIHWELPPPFLPLLLALLPACAAAGGLRRLSLKRAEGEAAWKEGQVARVLALNLPDLRVLELQHIPLPVPLPFLLPHVHPPPFLDPRLDVGPVRTAESEHEHSNGFERSMGGLETLILEAGWDTPLGVDRLMGVLEVCQGSLGRLEVRNEGGGVWGASTRISSRSISSTSPFTSTPAVQIPLVGQSVAGLRGGAPSPFGQVEEQGTAERRGKRGSADDRNESGRLGLPNLTCIELAQPLSASLSLLDELCCPTLKTLVLSPSHSPSPSLSLSFTATTAARIPPGRGMECELIMQGEGGKRLRAFLALAPGVEEVRLIA